MSNPDTTAPGVEIVNEPDDFNATPAGTPVLEPSGNPHDAGAATHPRTAPEPADTDGATDGTADEERDTDGTGA